MTKDEFTNIIDDFVISQNDIVEIHTKLNDHQIEETLKSLDKTIYFINKVKIKAQKINSSLFQLFNDVNNISENTKKILIKEIRKRKLKKLI